MIAYEQPIMRIIPLGMQQGILKASHDVIPVIPVDPGFIDDED